ncbi:MAG: M14 family zinc carboxypeptidase [Solirubrobacterales bacterium]
MPVAATAKTGQLGSFGGVTVPGSPYRYAAISPRIPDKLTVVARIERDGGRISRSWYLRGSYLLPAATYDPDSGGGLSADGTTLVLSRLWRTYPPRISRFAVLKTQVSYEWHGSGRPPRFRQFPKFVDVPGIYSFNAISPDGTTVYLTRYRITRDHEPDTGPSDDFEMRALDVESGRLLPRPLPWAPRQQGPLTGVPITRASSGDGRWAYTLYLGDRRPVYLLVLDTVAGRAIPVELPRLPGPANAPANALSLRLRLEAGGRLLTVFDRSPDLEGARPLVRVDTSTLEARPGRRGTASIGMIPAWLEAPPTPPDPLLAFARTPRGPGNLLARRDVVGRSADGRRIELHQKGDPALSGEILVFGCIHGDECAAAEIQPSSSLTAGCPDWKSDVYVVPNLNPDGAARGSRLNGRGVDLNRNFPAGWRPIGERGDPQYSGPRPFSEPETRLAARIVRELEPEVTIWFHQYRGQRPFVRAWGDSAPAAREFASLAQLSFQLLPWPAGTAPNWQNHRFPGTSSFVVELPPGPLARGLGARLDDSLVRLGRKVSKD